MKVSLKKYGGIKTSVENDVGSIMIFQNDAIKTEDDLVMIFNAKMARKMIKAIRKAAKENGWEV